MNLPPFLQAESRARLLQGAAAGALLTAVVGFGFGGWVLSSQAQDMAEKSVNTAMVTTLAPLCVERFQRAANAETTMVALKATDSWRRDTFVENGGWATFPGSAAPNRRVAEACANMLNEAK